MQIPPGVGATGANVQIPLSRLSIGLESIPIFGQCYQRRGNNLLLIERFEHKKNLTLGQKPTFYPEITMNLKFEKCEFCEN